MASSHDLSCGERRSHQLSDTKTSPVPILQQDTYCPGHISHQDTCWHSLIQYCPTLYTCLTHIRTALLVTSWWRSWNMHFQKSAYFPGIKITRTQMLVRVFTISFTWLTRSHTTGDSQHLYGHLTHSPDGFFTWQVMWWKKKPSAIRQQGQGPVQSCLTLSHPPILSNTHLTAGLSDGC